MIYQKTSGIKKYSKTVCTMYPSQTQEYAPDLMSGAFFKPSITHNNKVLPNL